MRQREREKLEKELNEEIQPMVDTIMKGIPATLADQIDERGLESVRVNARCQLLNEKCIQLMYLLELERKPGVSS